MKGITTSIIFVLIGLLLITTGCPGPLSFSGVRSPNVIADGDGAIVVYQVKEKESRTTYLQKLDSNGKAIWGEKGVALYSEPGLSEGGGISSSLVNSDNNSVILTWEESGCIWVQKVDATGRCLWGSGNVRIADGVHGLKVESDGANGIILTWSDGNKNLNFQRIDSQGNVLWKIDSLVNTQFFDIDVDKSGNILVVWEDKGFNIFVQKLHPSGKTTWSTGGVPISESRLGVGSSKVVSDGAGGAIVAWISGIRNKDGVGIASQELYAQRVDATGNIMWPPDGVPVSVATPGGRPVFSIEPRIISDASSGAVILWREMLSIYAQKIDVGGNALWTTNGVQIWNGMGAQGSASFSVVGDNAGGVIVVWCYTPPGSSTDNNMVVRAQRVTRDGQKAWDNDGLALSNSSPGFSFLPLISQDGHGGIIAAWAAGKNVHNASLSYVQKINAEGRVVWGENGIRLTP